MNRILKIEALAVLCAVVFVSFADAQQVDLSYGNDNVIELVEGVDNQRVDFFVDNIGGKNYDTFELWIQIGDGGSVIGGTDLGPSIAAVELGESGTIFAGGQRGSGLDDSQTPLLWADFIDSALATDDGIGGTIVFDASGIGAGTTIAIRFEGITVGGTEFNTNFRGLGTGVENVSSGSNGTINVVAAVVPEPSSFALVLSLGAFVLRRRRV